MAKTYLQIESITSEAFAMDMEKRFSRIIDAKLLKLNPPEKEDKFITRQEVADLFNITLPTVHNLMNAKILKPYKVGHKTRFLFSEVKAAAINTGREVSVA
jgi:excisionase family DNA binding protein